MAAPSGTTWGSIVGGYGRVGIYIGTTDTNTQRKVTISTWFWSKYSCDDSNNSYYYNNNATSATTKIKSVDINTTVDSGEGWSTSNQVKLGESTYTYDKGTSAVTRNCAIKLTDVDRVGGTMTHTRSYTIPALESYTISYNANGGSGAPSSQTKYYGKTLTLSSTKPTRSGYTFVGWGTSSTDTTADYSAGGSYTANADDTLYAIWKKTIKLIYDANGGSGAPATQSSTIYNSTTSYKFTLSSTKPTRTGYTFLGWSTSKTATTSSYSSGGSITLSNNTTLYAVWSENKLTINYYSNYATNAFEGASNTVGSDKNVIVSTVDVYYDNDYSTYGLANYSTSSGSVYMTRTGYTATGNWGTDPNGGTLVNENTKFDTGQKIAEALGKSLKTGNAVQNLYAQWSSKSYIITYNSNGGLGNMPNTEIDWEESFTIRNNLFKKDGYKFVGWNVYRNNDNKWYAVGQGWFTESEIIANGYSKKLYPNQTSLTFNNSWIKGNETATNFTFFAVWEISGVIYIHNGTEFKPYVPYIHNGTDWDLYLAYIHNGTDWDIIS